MEERELIQLNVQLPVGALQSFTELVEQLRKLASETSKGGGPEPSARPVEEKVENSTFDLERFRLLSREPETPESVQAAQTAVREVPAVHQPVQKEISAPESAGAAADAPVVPEAGWREDVRPDAAGEEILPREEPAQEDVALPESQKATARTEEPVDGPQPVRVEETVQAPEAKIVEAEPDTPVSDAPAVRMDPESQIPAAEAVWAEMEERELEAPALQAETGPGAETPLGAGIVVSSGADAIPSRWSGVTEELVTSGAAPLTAEAVSLAFRRDGRRYDNGFPLY